MTLHPVNAMGVLGFVEAMRFVVIDPLTKASDTLLKLLELHWITFVGDVSEDVVTDGTFKAPLPTMLPSLFIENVGVVRSYGRNVKTFSPSTDIERIVEENAAHNRFVGSCVQGISTHVTPSALAATRELPSARNRSYPSNHAT